MHNLLISHTESAVCACTRMRMCHPYFLSCFCRHKRRKPYFIWSLKNLLHSFHLIIIQDRWHMINDSIYFVCFITSYFSSKRKLPFIECIYSNKILWFSSKYLWWARIWTEIWWNLHETRLGASRAQSIQWLVAQLTVGRFIRVYTVSFDCSKWWSFAHRVFFIVRLIWEYKYDCTVINKQKSSVEVF